MKLRVYGEEEKKDPVVNLKLVQKEDGYVDLIAVNEEGEPIFSGKILKILPDGTFSRYIRVNPLLDFNIDDIGRITERNIL